MKNFLCEVIVDGKPLFIPFPIVRGVDPGAAAAKAYRKAKERIAAVNTAYGTSRDLRTTQRLVIAVTQASHLNTHDCPRCGREGIYTPLCAPCADREAV